MGNSNSWADGHAGLSIRKTAELLKVSHPSLIKLMKGGNLFAPEEAESIVAQGFRGGNLVKLARYFSQARQVSEETRQHCLGLLEKAAIIGVQVFIDRMAGITARRKPFYFLYRFGVSVRASKQQKFCTSQIRVKSSGLRVPAQLATPKNRFFRRVTTRSAGCYPKLP